MSTLNLEAALLIAQTTLTEGRARGFAAFTAAVRATGLVADTGS